MPEGACDVAVIGGGPAGLFAAEVIAGAGHSVTVHDAMASFGRKFLMAGRGGLNLTHSEPFDKFLTSYGPAASNLEKAISAFPPQALQAWCEALGQPTFVGTSGRVFPKAMKASPLLRAWLRRLAAGGVEFQPRHRWRGWADDGKLMFETPDGQSTLSSSATVLALGGASWPKLGSDGGWAEILRAYGVEISPLRPSNCGFTVAWSETMRSRFSGAPLKRLRLRFGDEHAHGEAIITATGIEGGAIYALSGRLRDAIEREGHAVLLADLRPELTPDEIAVRLGKPRGKQSLSTFLRKSVQLSPPAIGLLQEAAHNSGEQLGALAPSVMGALIKAVPIPLLAPFPISRAISTAGGISFREVDETFMLRRRPGTFVAGEMLDWEAPTGGYLLQACFASGAAAGHGAVQWLERGAGA
jgi:uncharacterized flavoprotein (TIGR03862 family)